MDAELLAIVESGFRVEQLRRYREELKRLRCTAFAPTSVHCWTSQNDTRNDSKAPDGSSEQAGLDKPRSS